MVATAKAVKESSDESFTLGDLLDIYYGRKTYAVYDKSALQWNKFVKDFCADEATKYTRSGLQRQRLYGRCEYKLNLIPLCCIEGSFIRIHLFI